MYEEPPKMSKNKKIELIVLVVIISWILLFIINYVLYSNSKPLFLSIHVTHDYVDGGVDEYISLGYVYRVYHRASISKEELVPFWVAMNNPTDEYGLPQALKDYEVPDNPTYKEKFKGLLYYFKGGDVLGTYKCLNSSIDCNKATSGIDDYDLINKDPLTKYDVQPTMGEFYEKFAFVDDSYPQDDKHKGKNKIIYLYQFIEEDPVILAQYADVKGSIYDDYTEKMIGENGNYIVKDKDSLKWGIINITEGGTITEALSFEYDSISYDEDTGYYILCKDNVWFIYNLYKNEKVSEDVNEPIYDVWRNNNLTYYYKTGRDRTIGNDSFVEYSIYRIDGRKFLKGDRITEVVERDKYLFYLTSSDNVLHFLDYSGEEKYKIQLYFSELNYDFTSFPAFEIISEKEKYINLRVYKGRDKTSEYESYTVNFVEWEYNY